jgi:hypothetical protein
LDDRGGEMGDQCTAGLNFITLRPRRDVVEDYKTVLEAVYEPAAYFSRIRAVMRTIKLPRHPSKFNARLAKRDLGFLFRLMWHMTVRQPDLRRHFWAAVADTMRHNPAAFETVISLVGFYLHLGSFAQFLTQELDRQIATFGAPAEPSARFPLHSAA